MPIPKEIKGFNLKLAKEVSNIEGTYIIYLDRRCERCSSSFCMKIKKARM